jgi:hypothetical protein
MHIQEGDRIRLRVQKETKLKHWQYS